MVVEHVVERVKPDVRVWIFFASIIFSSFFKTTFQPFSPMRNFPSL